MCDFDKVNSFKGKWCASFRENNQSYYANGNLLEKYGYDKRTTVDMHTFILEPESGKFVDHKNHNTLDNRRGNLREIEPSQNSTNRKSRNSNNKSGYRNVSWGKYEGKWLVQLQVEGKNKVLGKFEKDDLDEAGKFAESMRNKYYGDFAGNN